MARLGKTWWGERFIEALESFTDRGRLQRGRGYSGDGRILAFAIADGLVSATVRGNVNPYYGVYTEPRYQTRIRMAPIPAKDWAKAILHLGSNAALVARLLMNEMPDTIDDAFADMRLHLLPRSRKDFALTDCSCPDGANPCKHIAGVYYRLAGQLDRDPFLLFELRGLPREKLNQALSATPLGRALATLSGDQAAPLIPAESYFTRPRTGAAAPDYHAFWTARHRLPTEIEPATPATVPAILVRKAGDFPAFWDRDTSFVAVMEELYQRVREKNREVL
jgi:uncharacterized Zn finger protein